MKIPYKTCMSQKKIVTKKILQQLFAYDKIPVSEQQNRAQKEEGTCKLRIVYNERRNLK